MRFFVELQYNGGAYCGWQRQNNAPTIQESIEKGLSTLLRTPIAITGAGRTDTGVHAKYYVAHFDIETLAMPLEMLLYKINLVLPYDIAILNIYEVPTELHARFSAIEREYTYVLEPKKNPFNRHTSWQYYAPLNIENMNLAAASLLRHSDFTSFAKLGSDNTNNICQIRHAHWHQTEAGALHFTIRANRFLRNMVRAIVGTLVDVGRGKYTVVEFEDIISSHDLSRASGGAPAAGLFLSDVRYPEQ